MSTTTYHVGSPQFIRRLDNDTAPWQDVSYALDSNQSITHRDVETDPNDGDKVYVVGMQARANSTPYYGVLVSSDAGVTWTIPTGTYSNTTESYGWYEVGVIDANNIVACGEVGWVIMSTDAGVTFNRLTQLPPVTISPLSTSPVIPTVFSIHWINPTTGVVGCRNNVFKTSDAGVTWTRLSGALIEDVFVSSHPGFIGGIHMSADEQVIVACGSDYIFQSTNGGTTWYAVYQWSASLTSRLNGLHLTWKNDNELWATGINDQIVKTTDGGLSWSVVIPFSPIGGSVYAAHIYTSQTGYVSNDAKEYKTVDGCTTQVLSEDVTLSGGKMIQAVWTYFTPTPCYVLTNCNDISCQVIVINDLANYVGQVIRTCNPIVELCSLSTECNCYTITQGVDCRLAQLVDLSDATYSFTCEECLPKCYKFTDCSDDTNTFQTSTDFSAYVGLVVNLSNCGDTCWLVSLVLDCTAPLTLNTVSHVYDNCLACLPPISPTIPPALIKRKVKPGYTTPGCSPEYTERINCKFAEQVYDEMVKVRYGITVCCEYDIDYWDIKKQLLDLKSIADLNPVLLPIT